MSVSEERLIVERIKEDIKNTEYQHGEHVNVMLRDGQILDIFSYYAKVEDGKVNPQDAYVYIGVNWVPSRSGFHYPFLVWYEDLLNAYLSKLGLYYWYSPAVTTGIRYIADTTYYEEYLTIEVSDLNIVVSNTNLPKIMFEVLGDKIISGKKVLTDKEYEKIFGMLSSQKLFAGHNFEEARRIIRDYYKKSDHSLAKEVARIAIDYYRIFQPYTVCYDMKTWKEVDCWSIKLD